MPKPLTIAGIRFPSQRAAEAHCRDILYAGAPGTEITGADAEFVEALFCVRPDKVLDLWDRNVIRYLRDWQPEEYSTNRWSMCFWAELDDGARIDFSFKAAIKLIADGEAAASGVTP